MSLRYECAARLSLLAAIALPYTRNARSHVRSFYVSLESMISNRPRQLTSRHKLLHAHGVNRLAD